MPFALINTATTNTVDTATSVTHPIDTTGANLLIVGVATYSAQALVSDTINGVASGNIWTALTPQLAGGDRYVQMFYCASPNVGVNHRFQAQQAGSYPAIIGYAFSGSRAIPLDSQNGTTVASGVTCGTGGVTPIQNSDLILTAAQILGTAPDIDGGFIDSYEPNSANNVGMGAAYLIQTAKAAVNPTWSWTGSGACAVAIACFKAQVFLPTITSDGGGDDADVVASGGALVTTVEATGDSIEFSITGGADSGAFEVDPASGQLLWLDFPPAVGMYEVEVTATNAAGSDSQTINIEVPAAPVLTHPMLTFPAATFPDPHYPPATLPRDYQPDYPVPTTP